jgi:hypothetical protein
MTVTLADAIGSADPDMVGNSTSATVAQSNLARVICRTGISAIALNGMPLILRNILLVRSLI